MGRSHIRQSFGDGVFFQEQSISHEKVIKKGAVTMTGLKRIEWWGAKWKQEQVGGHGRGPKDITAVQWE